VNVCRQWAALYRKMYPHATRIPDPRKSRRLTSHRMKSFLPIINIFSRKRCRH
jgi:hypothetical protein